MLELKNIKKKYDGKNILDGIDIKIQKGEIVTMLGPSGSGKTTLLNIILGITNIDEGNICFEGEDISKKNMKKRGFNVVFQDYALFPNLNAHDNIMYGLKNRPESVTKKELKSIIEFLELDPHLTKKIQQLSGGQKQRVALARTLVTKPKILLLDEPLSALDGVIKEVIKEKIIAITKKFNLTTIIVTHDPEEALTMGDKVIVLENGKIAQFGKPSELIKTPKNKFIDDFVLKQLHIKRKNIYTLFGEINE